MDDSTDQEHMNRVRNEVARSRTHRLVKIAGGYELWMGTQLPCFYWNYVALVATFDNWDAADAAFWEASKDA